MGASFDCARAEVALSHTRCHLHQRGQRLGDAPRNPEARCHAQRQADGKADGQRPALAKQAVAFPVFGVNLQRARAVFQILGLQRIQLGAN